MKNKNPSLVSQMRKLRIREVNGQDAPWGVAGFVQKFI